MRINGSLILDAVTSGSTATEILVYNTGSSTLERRSALPQASIVNLTTDLANKQPLSTTLTNWSAYNSNGIVVQTSISSWVARTITGAAAGVGVTNGDGVAGNPTLSLNGDLLALENLAVTGIAVRTGTSTWTTRTITGTAGQIVVTNGTGVSGNPTLTLDSTFLANNSLWRTGSTGTNTIRTTSGFNDATGSDSFATGGQTGNTNLASGITSVVLGGAGNSATAGLGGAGGNAVIGGSTNVTNASSSAIIGGSNNTIGNLAANSVIAGGGYNTITGTDSFIAATDRSSGSNIATISAGNSAIIAGANTITGAPSISGGGGNVIMAGTGSINGSSFYNVIIGSISNTSNINSSGTGNGIYSATGVTITGLSQNCVIIASQGTSSTITNATGSMIIGGNATTISGNRSVAIGSNHNVASQLSLVTGDGHLPTSSAVASLSYGTNTKATTYGERAAGIGYLGGFVSQIGEIIVAGVSTSATPIDLVDGAGNVGINIPSNEVWEMEVFAQATITSVTNRSNSRVFHTGRYQIKNVAGTMSAIAINTITPSTGETGATTFALSIGTFTGTRCRFLATGAASTTSNWIVRVQFTRQQFL